MKSPFTTRGLLYESYELNHSDRRIDALMKSHEALELAVGVVRSRLAETKEARGDRNAPSGDDRLLCHKWRRFTVLADKLLVANDDLEKAITAHTKNYKVFYGSGSKACGLLYNRLNSNIVGAQELVEQASALYLEVTFYNREIASEREQGFHRVDNLFFALAPELKRRYILRFGPVNDVDANSGNVQFTNGAKVCAKPLDRDEVLMTYHEALGYGLRCGFLLLGKRPGVVQVFDAVTVPNEAVTQWTFDEKGRESRQELERSLHR